MGTNGSTDVEIARQDPVDLIWFPKVLEISNQTGMQTLQASWRQEVWRSHTVSNFYYYLFLSI